MSPSDSPANPERLPEPDPLWTALEEARARIFETEELAQLGRWEWALSTDHVECSEGVFRIFGIEPGSVAFTLSHFLGIVHPNDREPLEKAIREAVEGGPAYSEKFRIIRPDNTIRWVYSRGRVELDSAGVPIRVVGTVQDITDLEHTQAELRSSEARFRSLFEQAAVGVAEIHTPSGQFLRINQKYSEILGRAEEELVYLGFQDVTHPEDLQEDLDNMEALKAGRISEFSMEKRYVRPDGTLAWVDLSVSPLWEPGGTPDHHVAVAVEITDKKLVTEALEESERLFRELAEHIKEVFWLFDWKAGRVLYVSPAWETIWGTPAEELYGDFEAWGRSIHPEDRNYAAGTFEKLAESGGGEAREYRIIRPDGTVRWISDRAFLIRDDTGEVVRVTGIAEDVTDKKEEEEERQVLQAKIQHSQKLESLGVLAGGIAHDFNNLLMAIIGNADLALEVLGPESPGRSYVEKIENTAERAAGLTNQMLAYSGKGRFLIQSIQLDRLVGEMAHLLETVISKKAELQFRFASDLPPIEADASQIRQIVMNLITNGSEALGEDTGALQIGTGMVEADRAYLSRCYLGDDLPEGTYAFLEVSDTGSGMDEDTRKKIFDPFFTTKFTGRGLGLAAVLGIVRGHGGTINVYSEPGMGSTFKVLLPLSALPAQDPVPPREPRQEASHGATVLVVEDDTAVLDVTSVMLEKSGFKVLKALDGRAGVETFKANLDEVALVILDMTMPVMDGKEAFQAMRQQNPEIRVILSSGYSEADATGHFEGQGLAGFIQKPYRAADLLAKVNDILKGT